MSKQKKLFNRLLERPKDFTYDNLKTLLFGYGYKEVQGNGSRVKFINAETKSIISLHKPHPIEILKQYQIADVIEELKRQGIIE